MTRADTGEVVKLSPSNWLAIVLFFGTQSVVLVGVGIGMHTRLAVLEDRYQRESVHTAAVIHEIKMELREIKLALKANEGTR